MSKTPEKWFSLRTDFFGRDAYMLGMFKLSPAALAVYIASIAYVTRWDIDACSAITAAHVGVHRRKPVVEELVATGFWVKNSRKDWYYVAHEGVLWRRGDGVRRRPIPTNIRKHVMERDNFACVECGSDSFLTLDHIFPYSQGGRDTVDNLRVLCRSCNSSKGARTDA